MIKVIRFALAGIFASGAAVAGTTAYMSQSAPVEMAEATAMSSTAGWLIPLIAIALIVLAAGNTSGSNYQ